MIEIVNEETEERLLYELDNQYHILPHSLIWNLGLSLMMGDLHHLNLHPYQRLEQMLFLEQTLKPQKIRFWLSKQNPNSYLAILYVLNLLRDTYQKHEIFIIDSGTHPTTPFPFISGFSLDEIKDLISLERKIEEEEIKRMIDLWDQLVKENGELRIVKNDTIKSVSIDYWDQDILKILEMEGPTTIVKLAAITMGSYIEHGRLPDYFYVSRVLTLIKGGKIRKISDGKPKDNHYLSTGIYETEICIQKD